MSRGCRGAIYVASDSRGTMGDRRIDCSAYVEGDVKLCGQCSQIERHETERWRSAMRAGITQATEALDALEKDK